MKWIITLTIILCAVFLLVPSFSQGAEVHGYLEFGKDIENLEAYAEIGISLEFDIWIFQNSIYGGWLTWFTLPEEGVIMKNILYDLYTIGYRVAYDKFYVDLKHYCRHPEELSYADMSQTTIAVGVMF